MGEETLMLMLTEAAAVFLSVQGMLTFSASESLKAVQSRSASVWGLKLLAYAALSCYK